MKIWFDSCDLQSYLSDDSNLKLGIGWYKHYKGHPWKGLTIQFYLLKWLVSINYVSDYDAYDRKINYRKYK